MSSPFRKAGLFVTCATAAGLAHAVCPEAAAESHYLWPSATTRTAQSGFTALGASPNWAGEIAAGQVTYSTYDFGGIFQVSGTIKVPVIGTPNSGGGIACPSSAATYTARQWVGIGSTGNLGSSYSYDTDVNVFQAGLTYRIDCGAASPHAAIAAFWQDNSTASGGTAETDFSDTVLAGDTVSITVTAKTPGIMGWTLTDKRAGALVWKETGTYTDGAGNTPAWTAEAITERLYSAVDGSAAPLPFPHGAAFPFSKLTFSMAWGLGPLYPYGTSVKDRAMGAGVTSTVDNHCGYTAGYSTSPGVCVSADTIGMTADQCDSVTEAPAVAGKPGVAQQLYAFNGTPSASGTCGN